MKANRVIVKAAKFARYKNGMAGMKITFPYNLETVNEVKQLEGRKYVPDAKPNVFWAAPLNIANVELLIKFRFQLCEEIQKFYGESKVKTEEIKPIAVKGIPHKLYPFQEKGVAFIEAKNGCALIGDEMGLGKTVQALAWLQLHPKKRPVIIVVPASLKLNWKKEANKWMPGTSVNVLQGTKPHKTKADVLIINYDILNGWEAYLKSLNPQVIIFDEIHYTKNNAAKRTKTAKRLAKGIPHVIGLSGTPIINRPVEIYNAIQMIDNSMFPNRWSFLHKYCGAKHNGFGWDFNGATNTAELHEKLTESLMIRRLKKDVLQDLPDKMYNYTPIELHNETEYRRAERDFISFVMQTKGQQAAERASGAQALVEIEVLKQLAVRGKMQHVIKWVEDFLESGEKLVLMATHKFVIDELMNHFANISVKIDGSVSTEQRQSAVEHFQNDNAIKLFIGNTKAAGVGLTLTAASNVAFVELPWSPSDVQQAEDRCHRIGQKKGVQVHFLLAADTIEEKIARLIDKKRNVVDAVLDGKDYQKESMLSELMAEYRE